ncbi:MAG: ECF transporter S component [Solirubrobacterales bacterium]|nr:ECF transporter S component [Solirubrobacterales bacterium]
MSWGLASMVLLLVALGTQLVAFERGQMSARSLALVAALAALAVAGRLAFAPLPNVKPTTDIVLIAGFALGASPGFAVGALTALVSNMVFGQGPWTPWQMFAWGLVGLFGALLAKATRGRIGRWQLAAAGALAGLGYGVVMDVSQWLLYGGTPKQSTLIAYSITSLPWNIAHAAGNAVFAIAFGPALISAVRRASQKLQPVWLPPGVPMHGFAIPALLVAVVAFPALAGGARHAVSSGSAGQSVRSQSLRWLLAAQNRDGGFPESPGSGATSSPRETAWAALALAAAGKDLSRVRKSGGRSVVEALISDSRQMVSQTGDSPEERAGWEERLALAAAAAGANPHDFGGHNLVAEVRARIGKSGAVNYYGPGDPSVNLTAYAILALRAGGVPRNDRALSRAARWLGRQQQRDGGFSISPRGAVVRNGDVDTTGAVLQALRSAGRSRDLVVGRAHAFLVSAQGSGGGFSASTSSGANAQSTAMGLLGLRAFRLGGSASSMNEASGWLARCLESSGRVDYSPAAGGRSASRQTPVWVTAQVLLAESGRNLPIITPVRPGRFGVPGSAGVKGAPQTSAASAAARKKRARKAEAIRVKRLRVEAGRVASVSTAVVAGHLLGVLVRAFSGANR